MTVGEAARLAGVSAKALRTWEAAGLVPPARRSPAGHRVYAPADLDRLRFVARARALGFGLERVRVLLDLWRDRSRPSAEVKRLALAQAEALEAEAAALRGMAAALSHLAEHCRGDERPDCPILDELEGAASMSPGRARV